MSGLLFDKIAAVRTAISSLEDLVAVFSQKHGPRLLFVYNSDTLPAVPGELIEVTLLNDFPDEDISEFDGPLVGFSALDVVRDDLLTKGPNFFPIERIFLERGQRELLHRTMLHLAGYFVDSLSKWPDQRPEAIRQRAEGKVLQMALPSILSSLPCENLIAILPARDLSRFTTHGDCETIYIDRQSPAALRMLAGRRIDSNQNWVIAFEELSLYNPGIQASGAKFIELRGALQYAGQETALQTTRCHLAQACHSLRANNPDCRQAALQIMAEYWLASEDVEDLIALCPHDDFECFAGRGDALRVYRLPVDEARLALERPGPRVVLEKLLWEGLPPGYQETLMSFSAISSSLPGEPPARTCRLSEILWKAGHAHTLARTLWLLSFDLLQRLPEFKRGSGPGVDQVVRLAARACSIYGLSNPWQWRQGRWELYLESSYRNLLAILDQSTQASGDLLAPYYAAIQAWYGCWLTQDTGQELRQMLTQLKEFQRATRDQRAAGLETYLAQAARLVEVGETIMRLPAETGSGEGRPAEPGNWLSSANPSVPGAVRQSLQSAAPLPILSALFSNAWLFLLEVHRKRQRLYSQERDVGQLIRQLASLCSDLRRAKSVLYARPHERAVLELAYQQEIEHLETLLHGLETAARLTVDLKNPWVDMHQEVNLELEIANRGQVEAEGLEVLLAQPKGFQLLEESAVREIAVVQPGATAHIHYKVRPEHPDAELRLEFSFRDRRGQRHTDAWTRPVKVRSLDEVPFQVKVNPYQFGPPIKNPGDFYGRRVELQIILSHLKAEQKQTLLLLRGPRRMGKTSLLYMLEQTLKQPRTRRLFAIEPAWDAELSRIHPVFLSLHAIEQQGGILQVSQFFRSLLERVTDLFRVDPAERKSLLDTYQLRERQIGSVNAALEQINRLLDARPGERVTVLLDEYDEVYRPGSGGLDRNLREFVSTEQRLSWIIASTLALFKETKSVSSPWFNVFTIVELERLPQEAAIDLVELPSRGERTFWRSDAVLSLLGETGRHPAFTQLFCSKVIEFLNRAKTNYVLQDTIAAVANQIVDEQETAHSHFEFYWSDTSGVGQLILLILDDQDAPLKRDEIRRHVLGRLEAAFGTTPVKRVTDSSGNPIEWREKEFKSGMDAVEKIANAISPNEQRRYVFTVPLFRRWLRRQRQNEDLPAGTLDKIAKELERDGLVAV